MSMGMKRSPRPASLDQIKEKSAITNPTRDTRAAAALERRVKKGVRRMPTMVATRTSSGAKGASSGPAGMTGAPMSPRMGRALSTGEGIKKGGKFNGGLLGGGG